MKINFHIEQSRTINIPATQLKKVLTDLNLFLLWSPWNCLDDNGQSTVSNPPHQEGHALHWQGPIIGEGIQTINKISEFSIESGLQFIKPFKSFSPTKYELKPHGESTELTWTMDGSLPIFLFFLKKFMTVMLTRDLDRGLDRLKELCEEGKVNSKLSPVEKIHINACYFQGIESKCKLEEIALYSRKAFDQINSDIESKKIVGHAGILSVYHDINPMKGTTHFTAGVYFHSEPNKIEGYRQGKIESHDALKLISQGPYHHLKSAWGKAFSYQRVNKLKVNSKVPMVEIMLNDPNRVAKDDILTEVRLPIK